MTESTLVWSARDRLGCLDVQMNENIMEDNEEGEEEEKGLLASLLAPPGGHDKRTSGSRKMFVLWVV
ncbi:uncharacterized protein N7529_007766 [Penicillium soppii]|uniref:uncharacterized protein n=1 Tax=Penicillium soppii TaxID=69789 RepID=UPI00254967E5|nr:uncharacterized protein N7529_007766 [Penicillium soppii]KAJ5860456.1 hypothetical protein N7529_007766 [Penicillium soppii]